MKNYYEIEFYDTVKDIGKGTIGMPYTNKEIAIKEAKEIYKNLCNKDKKHINILVNKCNRENGEIMCIKEINK